MTRMAGQTRRSLEQATGIFAKAIREASSELTLDPVGTSLLRQRSAIREVDVGVNALQMMQRGFENLKGRHLRGRPCFAFVLINRYEFQNDRVVI